MNYSDFICRWGFIGFYRYDRLMIMRISEAQNATFELHSKIEESNKIKWTPFVTVVDILEEAGEVAQVVKNLEGYSPHQKRKTKEMLSVELSDLLWSIFVLAGMYEVHLEKAYQQTLISYEARFLKG